MKFTESEEPEAARLMPRKCFLARGSHNLIAAFRCL